MIENNQQLSITRECCRKFDLEIYVLTGVIESLTPLEKIQLDGMISLRDELKDRIDAYVSLHPEQQ